MKILRKTRRDNGFVVFFFAAKAKKKAPRRKAGKVTSRYCDEL